MSSYDEDEAAAALAGQVLAWASSPVLGADGHDLLGLARLSRIVDRVIRDEVGFDRAGGRSWSQIGADLGVTKQAAQQKYGQSYLASTRTSGATRPGSLAIDTACGIDNSFAEALKFVRSWLNTLVDNPTPEQAEALEAVLRRYHKRALRQISEGRPAIPTASSVPKTSRERPSAALSLVNDVRLYLNALATSPQVAELSPAARGHIIAALQDAIDTVNDGSGEVLGADVGKLRAEGGG